MEDTDSSHSYNDMNNMNSFCDLKSCFGDVSTTRMGIYQYERPLPPVPGSHRASEDVFAAALHSLTFQEREAIAEEIHGVGNNVIEETMDRVQDALKRLREDYLSNDSPHRSRQNPHSLPVKREAYDQAVFLRPMIEKDDKLHLMFLRAQSFNPRMAAQHMFLYFENKRTLFGDKLLTQKITLKDLTDHEVCLVREGAIQLLAGREMTGRGVAYHRIGQYDLSSPLAFSRAIWYIMSAVEDDEDMQRNGVVMIGDWHGPFRHSPYDNLVFLVKIQPIVESWTFRVASIHSLYGNGTFVALIQSLFAVTSKHIQVRHRFHFGSQLETMYSLRTFGIDMGEESSPSSSSWSILPGSKATTMDEYIQRRLQTEEQWREKEKIFQEPTALVALVPNQNDILMVRSKFATTWPGNKLYHNMILQYSPRYINPDSNLRIDKTLIIREVIHVLQKDHGSRFLSRKETRWVVSEDAATQKKVNQSLRQEARNSLGRHSP